MYKITYEEKFEDIVVIMTRIMNIKSVEEIKYELMVEEPMYDYIIISVEEYNEYQPIKIEERESKRRRLN